MCTYWAPSMNQIICGLRDKQADHQTWLNYMPDCTINGDCTSLRLKSIDITDGDQVMPTQNMPL